MAESDERAAASEQKAIDDQARTYARFSRMEDQYVTIAQLNEKCRGCHKVDSMRHEETIKANSQLAGILEKFEMRMELAIKEFGQKLETYIPPVVHWVGELKTGALGAFMTLSIGLILYIVTR